MCPRNSAALHGIKIGTIRKAHVDCGVMHEISAARTDSLPINGFLLEPTERRTWERTSQSSV